MLSARSRKTCLAAALAALLFPACQTYADSPDDAPAPTAPVAPPVAEQGSENSVSNPEQASALCGDGTCKGDVADCAAPYSFLWENLSVFGGLDGSKEPEDLGINAHFGYRVAVNNGLPLLEQYGLGVQAGTALNYSNNAVRVLKSIDNTRNELQSFTTVGLFQRSDVGVNWGLVYDFRFDNYYEHLHFGQWRGQVGYNLTADDEVGVRAAVRDFGQDGSVGKQSFRLRPITQGDLFWRHIWENDTVTRLWVGMAEGHGRFLLVAPGESPVHHPVAFGAELYVPLTDRLAIFGEANFITPNDTGTVDATLGFAFYPGGGARRSPRSRFAPLQPLGNNSSFSVDLRQ